MVEVDAGHDSEGWVGGGWGAVDAGIVADLGAHPVGREVVWVGIDGSGLPCLQDNVRLLLP